MKRRLVQFLLWVDYQTDGIPFPTESKYLQ